MNQHAQELHLAGASCPAEHKKWSQRKPALQAAPEGLVKRLSSKSGKRRGGRQSGAGGSPAIPERRDPTCRLTWPLDSPRISHR
jgi:hypothetical protein